ncbi:hypothetical protein PUN28_018069 [Cardiocondyla obscurior]|uniref:Uncharacterized protein n=1 Tax=Cardiocondyla obscurior TaxID=286306 RepID=A0AAW2EJI1_9HYME
MTEDSPFFIFCDEDTLPRGKSSSPSGRKSSRHQSRKMIKDTGGSRRKEIPALLSLGSLNAAFPPRAQYREPLEQLFAPRRSQTRERKNRRCYCYVVGGNGANRFQAVPPPARVPSPPESRFSAFLSRFSFRHLSTLPVISSRPRHRDEINDHYQRRAAFSVPSRISDAGETCLVSLGGPPAAAPRRPTFPGKTSRHLYP